MALARQAAPVLVVFVFSLPCMNFTYLWDDYDFLTKRSDLQA